MLAGAILISIGLERRTSHERAAALSSEDARAAWLHEVGLRDERDLTSALLRQRSLLDAASKAPPSRDAAESLAMLINA